MPPRRLGAILSICGLSLLSVGAGPARAAEDKWQGAVPKLAQDNGAWVILSRNLVRSGMYYGALAAAKRMTIFFSDLPTKEAAYQTIVNLIDGGYPLPARELFATADIEPDPSAQPDFANSYYLYKAILSQDKKIDRWAEYYFAKVDRQNFPKYLYYKTLEQYGNGDLLGAADTLRKILARDLPAAQLPLLTKASRTLARIYFEQREYEKSLDIYESFLLRLNPIFPSDWLEAAWDHYYLKQYEKSLGDLYNLESKAAGASINLEKYSLRALIYRHTCSQPRLDALIDSFNRNFGGFVSGIKRGAPLTDFPILKTVLLPENRVYNQNVTTLSNLNAEVPQISSLPAEQRALAGYLYRTEAQMLTRSIRAHTSQALSRVASELLVMSEQLRFLKFDIARSRFNPDTVFKPNPEQTPTPVLLEGADHETYSLSWPQVGEYWIDERNKYEGVLPNQCVP